MDRKTLFVCLVQYLSRQVASFVVPSRVEDLNEPFFERLVGRPVSAVVRNRKKEDLPLDQVGAGGAGTSRAWVRVDFKDGTSEFYFVKLPAPTLAERMFLTVFGVYKNEINFYERIRDRVPSDLTAKPLYSRMLSTKFVLVLRDMSTRRKPCFPTILQPYPQSRVLLVLRSLARFHASNWNRPPRMCGRTNGPPEKHSRRCPPIERVLLSFR